jgi:Mg2+-importing ATPase
MNSPYRRDENALAATLIIVVLTIALPYLPFVSLIGFQPLSFHLLVLFGGIVALYIATAEAAKRIFYRRIKL